MYYTYYPKGNYSSKYSQKIQSKDLNKKSNSTEKKCSRYNSRFFHNFNGNGVKKGTIRKMNSTLTNCFPCKGNILLTEEYKNYIEKKWKYNNDQFHYNLVNNNRNKNLSFSNTNGEKNMESLNQELIYSDCPKNNSKERKLIFNLILKYRTIYLKNNNNPSIHISKIYPRIKPKILTQKLSINQGIEFQRTPLHCKSIKINDSSKITSKQIKLKGNCEGIEPFSKSSSLESLDDTLVPKLYTLKNSSPIPDKTGR